MFSLRAGFGAASGWGVKHGIYSGEAGQGTGRTLPPFSVYITTLLVCSATALVILMTKQYNVAAVRPGIIALRDHERQQKENRPVYTFGPQALGIKDAALREDKLR